MKRRDRRFGWCKTYVAHKVKWTRHVNLAAGQMTWTCRTLHPVRIERNRSGQYGLMCAVHGQIASTWRLRNAFRMAAVHMGYSILMRPPRFVHRAGCQRDSACQCPPQ